MRKVHILREPDKILPEWRGRCDCQFTFNRFWRCNLEDPGLGSMFVVSASWGELDQLPQNASEGLLSLEMRSMSCMKFGRQCLDLGRMHRQGLYTQA